MHIQTKRRAGYLCIHHIDETQIQIGPNEAWLWWIAIEPIHHRILGVYISRHRNMLVAGVFLRSLIKLYGKHTVYSDGERTWYPEACNSLGLKHSPFEKSIIERSMEYVKDRTEGFDDYYLCMKKKEDFYCSISHVHKWVTLFIFMYNNTVANSNTNPNKINNWLRGD